YRTELGAALNYTLQACDAATGRAATLRCFVKVYRNDHGEHTFELLQSLGQRGERGEIPYSVVRPVAYRADLRTLVLEEAPGTALQWLLRGGHDAANVLRITARAVAAFNQDDLGGANVAESPLAVQLEELRRGASIVEWARPELAAQVRAITAAVAAGLEEVAPAPIHGDLKPDHVFLAGDRVIFIDLDSLVLGDPVRDPAHMFAYVAGRVGLDAMPAEEARAAGRRARAGPLGRDPDHAPRHDRCARPLHHRVPRWRRTIRPHDPLHRHGPRHRQRRARGRRGPARRERADGGVGRPARGRDRQRPARLPPGGARGTGRGRAQPVRGPAVAPPGRRIGPEDGGRPRARRPLARRHGFDGGRFLGGGPTPHG